VNEAPVGPTARPLRYRHSKAGVVQVAATRAGDGGRVSCLPEGQGAQAVWETSTAEPVKAFEFVGGRIHVVFLSGRVDVLDRETGRLLGRK
jgi:hypothetical protein